MEDERLMLDYAAGDLRAFELLFERWAPRLHAFFRRSFGNAVDADDLLQLTFLRVHRSRRRFQEGWPLRAWLFSIAARLRLDELRRRRNAQTNAQTFAGGEEEAQLPFEAERNLERISLLQAVLEDLSESQRTVIHLHRYERMTFAEIAQLLGTTEGAIKLRAFRAYRRLRALLTPLLAKDDAA